MRSCGIQPAHQSLINRRLEVFASGYAQKDFKQPPSRNGPARPTHLKMDMRITPQADWKLPNESTYPRKGITSDGAAEIV
jgi:hypothetical protein